MEIVEKMLGTVPGAKKANTQAFASCVQACFSCEATCVMCADACRREPQIDMLRQCIRLNLDCADLCGATGRLVARAADGASEVLRTALEACARACAACAAECRRHASMHEHCRVCADECERCERECREALRNADAS